MRRPPTPAVAALALTLYAPVAAAERVGFLIGFTLGRGGSNDCDNCGLVGGPALAFHPGATVTSGLAVLGEFSVLAFSGGDDTVVSLGFTWY